MTQSRFLGLLAAALVLTPAFAIPPPPPQEAPPGAATYPLEQLEAMPPGDLARLLFSDWSNIFVEKRMDEKIGFYTKPQMAHAGVCSVTRLSIATSRNPRDGRMFVGGIAVEKLYHLVDLPGPFAPTLGVSFDATRPLCDVLPAGTKYFAAPSARVVAYQHHLIAEAVAKANSSGRLPFKLECIRSAEWGCEARKVLAGIDPSSIRGIVTRDCGGFSRHECYEIAMGDWYLEVESRASTYAYTLVDPEQILVSIGVSKLPHYLLVDSGCCTD